MMTVEDINESLIGKRIEGNFGGEFRQGTVIDLLEDEYVYGFVVKVDKPVFMMSGDFDADTWYQDTFEVQVRKYDNFDWGALKSKTIISDSVKQNKITNMKRIKDEQRDVSYEELDALQQEFETQLDEAGVIFDNDDDYNEALDDFIQQYIEGDDDPQIDFSIANVRPVRDSKRRYVRDNDLGRFGSVENFEDYGREIGEQIRRERMSRLERAAYNKREAGFGELTEDEIELYSNPRNSRYGKDNQVGDSRKVKDSTNELYDLIESALSTDTDSPIYQYRALGGGGVELVVNKEYYNKLGGINYMKQLVKDYTGMNVNIKEGEAYSKLGGRDYLNLEVFPASAGIHDSIKTRVSIRKRISDAFNKYINKDFKNLQAYRRVTDSEGRIKEDVVFLIEDSDVLAVFPNTYGIATRDRDTMVCYSHNGQHGVCTYDYANTLKTAVKDNYQALQDELTNYVGYNLTVVDSLPSETDLKKNAQEVCDSFKRHKRQIVEDARMLARGEEIEYNGRRGTVQYALFHGQGPVVIRWQNEDGSEEIEVPYNDIAGLKVHDSAEDVSEADVETNVENVDSEDEVTDNCGDKKKKKDSCKKVKITKRSKKA